MTAYMVPGISSAEAIKGVLAKQKGVDRGGQRNCSKNGGAAS